jgi:cytochrome c-type biogenesis protein CcmH/NrfF
MIGRMIVAACMLGLLAAPRHAEAALQAQPAEQPAASRVVQETLIDRQTRELSSKLRCVVCQGLSLQDSPSQLAQEMRGIVREKLEEGMTPDEVKEYFVARYGEWVLLAPEPKGFNLVVYVLPIAMLFGGAGFVFFTARNWTRPDDERDEVEQEEQEEQEEQLQDTRTH